MRPARRAHRHGLSTPPQPADAPDGLLEALGVAPSYIGRSLSDKFVLVESEPVLRSLAPDFARLAKIDVRGVIVTSASLAGDRVRLA